MMSLRFLTAIGLFTVTAGCSGSPSSTESVDAASASPPADAAMHIDVQASAVSAVPGQTLGLEITGLEPGSEVHLADSKDAPGVSVELDAEDSTLKVKVSEDVMPGDYDIVVVVSAPGFVEDSDNFWLKVVE